MPSTLGYFRSRGLAQHIRYLLEYTGEDYEEKIFDFGQPPEYDKAEWLQEKFKLGLEFPNLPFFIDGDLKLTQSNAIFRHIARKHNLLGETDVEKAKADMLVCEALDVRTDFRNYCRKADFENTKDDFISQTMNPKLTQLSQFLSNNDWFMGKNIQYADFFIYEVLACFKLLSSSTINEFENLKLFMERFESLEPIKKYMNSERFIKYPFQGPGSYFAGV